MPEENRCRESVVKLIRELVALLTKRQNKEKNLDPEDKELIVTFLSSNIFDFLFRGSPAFFH